MRQRGSRKPKPKQGELVIWYGSLDKYTKPDLVASWGGMGASKSDGGLVLFSLNPYHFALKPGEKTLIQDLEERGYDLHTLEFRIRKTRHLPWRSMNKYA